MKTLRTKAIVVRRTNYGEADRIIQLITPQYGKLSVMARGVRKEKSKLAGGIELFARCDVTVTSGRSSDLYMLTGARLEVFYRNIMSDYDHLQFGYEAIKQVSKAADALDEPAFFDLLDQTFQWLDIETIDLKVTKAWFWLQLAILMGIGMNLSTDDNGMKLVEEVRYDFDVVHGVFVFRENGRFTSDHIKILRLLSAKAPGVAMQVNDLGDMIDDCLWVAEHAVAR